MLGYRRWETNSYHTWNSKITFDWVAALWASDDGFGSTLVAEGPMESGGGIVAIRDLMAVKANLLNVVVAHAMGLCIT